MKYKKTITILVICIVVLSTIATLCGLFFTGGQGEYQFKSVYGEIIKIYGKGLYRYESMEQKLALGVQDIVTLGLSTPLLILSLCLSLKGSIKGRLLLTGTIGYFLYSYTAYTFLRVYNPLFMIYVILMSTSLFAFILCMMSFDLEKFSLSINPKMPVKFIGGFQILVAIGLIGLWLPPIVISFVKGTIPFTLQHYTTLGFEAMDLGFIVPTLFLSAVLIIKRRTFGYFLSAVLIMQCITMTILISVLTVVQVLDGMKMSIVVMAMFPVFTLITIYCLILILKNIKEPT